MARSRDCGVANPTSSELVPGALTDESERSLRKVEAQIAGTLNDSRIGYIPSLRALVTKS